MNENKVNNSFSVNNVCRVCLNTTKHLSPMSNEHAKLYISLVDEIVYMENKMKICVICHWMLQRFAKFKHQCWTVNHMLNEATYKDSKLNFSLHNNLIISHHMTQTSPSIHNYIPSLDILHNDTQNYSVHKRGATDNYTSCNTLLNTDNDHHKNDQDFADTFENHEYMTDNDKYTNGHDDNTTKTENDTNDISDDNDDELPLVLLSKKSKERIKKKLKKKKKAIEERDSPYIVNTEDSSVNQEKQVKSKRSKKVLRDGFSSRMVQETHEYIVIKLTKEQVLLEMMERSKTDAYVSSPHKCDKCVKGFNFQDVLVTHMEKHSEKNGTFKCDMCEQYCPSAVSLRGHLKSHTTRYKCKVCGAVRVARQHLMEHHAQHSGAAPGYQCLHCTFTTNKRTVMQRHARTHAPREPHACDKCGKLFKTIDYLRLHAARHDKSSRFKCDHCPDTFVYHSLLRRHVQCVHERKEFYCVECDVQFKSAESLRVHFKRAKRHRDSTGLKHACNKCPARFFTAGSLATHLSSTHDAFKQHACQHCHRTYSTRDAVRAHTWRVHARGDARAACPHCHTSFARKSVLKAHLRAHRGACGARERALHDDLHDKHEKEELPQYENKIEV